MYLNNLSKVVRWHRMSGKLNPTTLWLYTQMSQHKKQLNHETLKDDVGTTNMQF